MRGDNMNPVGYALAAFYLKSIDTLGLLEKLSEDESFGAVTYALANKTVALKDALKQISRAPSCPYRGSRERWAECRLPGLLS